MQIALLLPHTLTEEERDSLWAQDVCLDDWDYGILAPGETVQDGAEIEGATPGQLVQREYILERLLTGCCDNRWHKVTLRGTEYALGMVYHA